jgi:glutamate racemase
MHEKGFPYLNKSNKELKKRIWKIVKEVSEYEEIPDDFEVHLGFVQK